MQDRAGYSSVKYDRRDMNKVTHRVIGEMMRPSLLLDLTGKGSAVQGIEWDR